MGESWIPLPINQAVFANADPDAIAGYQTAIENGFINELGGHSRFPGLKVFATLPDKGRVYLHDWNGNLVAGSSRGRLFTLDPGGAVTDRTGTLVSGGRRIIFSKTNYELLMAAGGPIVRLRDLKTELLSDAAPLASHVQWIDGYTVAAEVNSNRFYHTAAGLPDSWDALDTYAADGDPDPVNAIMVTPFKELMVGGRNSIEQFESAQSGDSAFFRRWSVGEGVAAPYCMVWADNSMFTVNKLYEVVKASGQVAISASAEISRILERVDNWEDAWMGGFPDKPLHVAGQKFVLMQLPHATNAYGSKGITLLYDYRQKKWYELYGFDVESGTPVRWPGWSHWTLWGRTFVGGEGVIYEVTNDSYSLAGAPQRWLLRTGYIADGNQVQIKRLRVAVKRGMGGGANGEAFLAVRCRRDNKPFGSWIRRSLGRHGQSVPNLDFGSFGTGYSFQFEFSTSDDVQLEIMKAEIQTDPVGH